MGVGLGEVGAVSIGRIPQVLSLDVDAALLSFYVGCGLLANGPPPHRHGGLELDLQI